MEITYLGHSSFKLKGKNASLVTDPFDPQTVGLKFPKVEAEIVTISHNHQDHNRADLVSNVRKVINGPGEYEIAGISIIGLKTWHDQKKGEERGGNTAYLIEIGGVRVLHLGDLGHSLKEKTINELGDVDILLIPIGGEYTVGPKEAAEIVKALEPTIIIPMHYQAGGLNQQHFGQLEKPEVFLSLMDIKVERLPKLKIKAGDLLTEEQKIIILERK